MKTLYNYLPWNCYSLMITTNFSTYNISILRAALYEREAISLQPIRCHLSKVLARTVIVRVKIVVSTCVVLWRVRFQLYSVFISIISSLIEYYQVRLINMFLFSTLLGVVKVKFYSFSNFLCSFVDRLSISDTNTLYYEFLKEDLNLFLIPFWHNWFSFIY